MPLAITARSIGVTLGRLAPGPRNAISDVDGVTVGHADVERAVGVAAADFAQGDVGAGKGMSCFELKGGIGTASRRIELDGKGFHLGALVLSNFGRRAQLRIAGKPIGGAGKDAAE